MSCAEAELTTTAAPHNNIAAHKILTFILLFINFDSTFRSWNVRPARGALIATARDDYRPERFRCNLNFFERP